MRLLHIFSAPQSAFFFLDKQLQFMVENGLQIHIIIPDDGFFSKKLVEREPNVKFHYVGLRREISIWNDLKSLFSIYSLIRKIKPDILHLHTPKASFIGALAGRLAFQKIIIYQMHGLVSAEGTGVEKRFLYNLEKYTCSLVTNVFAVSHSLRAFAIEKKYTTAKKIEVIGNGTINGIDWQNRFNPLNASNHYKYLPKEEIDRKFVLGYVGRISYEKGIEDFLAVVSRLKDKVPLLAVIVGPNELKQGFDELLGKHNLHNSSAFLKVFDEIYDPENIICHFSVLLFPTKREGFGLVAAEANAMSVPVVAYNIPGIQDAVENGSTGTLIPYGDVTGLTDAVLNYYKNETERSLHGKNGRLRVIKQFTQEELWKNILQVYKKLYSSKQ